MKHISLTNFIVFVVLFVCPTFVCGQGENINLVNETVYINHVDSKFHREYCKELVFTKRPIKVKDALLKKYIPCDVCGASIRYIDIDIDKDKDKFIFEEAKQETIIFREDADLFRPDIPEYCPYKYFTNPLPKFASFYALRTLIQKHGKLTVFNTTRRLSNSIVTIRVGDDFKEFLGTPDQKYVDECTIMFDLISLRLSSDETERQLLAFKAEERKKEEYRLEAERRIAEEKQKGEETRRLEGEKRLQEKKQNEEEIARLYEGSEDYKYAITPLDEKTQLHAFILAWNLDRKSSRHKPLIRFSIKNISQNRINRINIRALFIDKDKIISEILYNIYSLEPQLVSETTSIISNAGFNVLATQVEGKVDLDIMNSYNLLYRLYLTVDGNETLLEGKFSSHYKTINNGYLIRDKPY